MRVLIVRFSSMGDMVHTLPAVTDAARAIPNLEIDWVVDRLFAEIPAWHRAVRDVIAAPDRRLGNLGSSEFKSFFAKLRSRHYDLIVDLQAHWKTAFAARLAKGKLSGYDSRSVNEWGSHFFYNAKHFVPRQLHSIRRMRELLALSLNYKFDTESVDYGIDRMKLPANPLNVSSPYLVFIHSTSWSSKCWPEAYWRDLADHSIGRGFHVVLPWGNEAERLKAQRIAGDRREATVLPQLTISQKASVIAEASGTVGLDTGLSHIAAALDVPSITIYGATDPLLIGATGKNQILIASKFECLKCHASECSYSKDEVPKPACLNSIGPDLVSRSLEKLLKERVPASFSR